MDFAVYLLYVITMYIFAYTNTTAAKPKNQTWAKCKIYGKIILMSELESMYNLWQPVVDQKVKKVAGGGMEVQ